MFRWSKELSNADAQQPRGANTNPTGHLTLVQAGHNIDSATWFRNSLFSGLHWVGPANKERVVVAMDVNVMGVSHGMVEFEISHTPSFEAQQGNRATVLHWGNFNATLQRTNLSGKFVTLERDGANFKLTIADRPAGPSIV